MSDLVSAIWEVWVKSVTSPSWAWAASIALLISFFIVAILYIIAEGFRLTQLQAWARNEVYEVIISLLIIATLFTFLGFIDGISEALSGKDSHELAFKYLEDIAHRLFDCYMGLIIIDEVFGILMSLGFGIAPVEVGGLHLLFISFAPLSGLGVISEALVLFTDFIAVFHIANEGQAIFLDFVKKYGFTFFLPLGVVLRTFPITRRLGSTIIALAVTTYAFYPLTLIVINKHILENTKIVECKDMEKIWFPPGGDVDKLHKEIKIRVAEDPEKEKKKTECETKWYNPWTWITCGLHRLWETGKVAIEGALGLAHLVVDGILIGGRIWVSGTFGGWFGALKELIELIGHFLVLAIMLPIVDIIICITFFRSFSGAIGGETEIPGLAKIV